MCWLNINKMRHLIPEELVPASVESGGVFSWPSRELRDGIVEGNIRRGNFGELCVVPWKTPRNELIKFYSTIMDLPSVSFRFDVSLFVISFILVAI